jgi:saccharopine dehydrogenase-like NADP-dependent oxidoreductase
MEMDLKGVAPGVYYVLVEYQMETGHRKLKPINIYVPGRS